MRAGALVLLLAPCLQLISGKYIMEFVYFGNCKESDKTAFYHVENTQFGMVSAEASEFNTTVVFTKDMDVITVNAKIYKCKSASEADCEIMMTVPVPDYCRRIHDKGQFYSTYAENAHPPLACPFKKGTHRITHARVNVNSLEGLIEDNIIYNVQFAYYYHGTYAGCFMIKLKKTRLRVRKKNGRR